MYTFEVNYISGIRLLDDYTFNPVDMEINFYAGLFYLVIEDYEIDDMKIYTKDGWCYIEFTLTNIGDSKCNDNNCSLHLTFYKDKKRTEYFAE